MKTLSFATWAWHYAETLHHVLMTKTSRSTCCNGKMILLVMLFLCAPFFLFSQNNNDVVLISSGTNYLSTNATNGVVNVTTPNQYSLWRCTISDGKYHFQSVATGQYLKRDDTSLKMDGSGTAWNKSGKKFYYKAGGGKYLTIRLNRTTWDLNSMLAWQVSGTDLTFTTMTASLSSMSADKTAMSFPVAGGNETVTITSSCTYTGGGKTIKWTNFTYTTSIQNSYSNHFTTSTSNSGVTVNAQDNTNQGSPKNTTMTITSMFGKSVTVTIQQATNIAFAHQRGHSNRALLGNGMQGVHTERLVYYVKQNETVALTVPESSFPYSRWYDYGTDAKIASGAQSLSGYTDMVDNKGVYKLTNSVEALNYTNESSQTSGVIAEIACDLSYYKDYTIVNNYLVKEPTLSQRVIFEIRPAAEIATALAACTTSSKKYLEEYTMVAPVGKVIRIGPKYTYTGSRINYYQSATQAVTNPVWKKEVIGSNNKTQINSPTVTNDRVLEVAAVTSAQKVTYTLEANGLGIARFTVEYKAQTEVGPSQTAIKSESVLSTQYKYVTGLNFDGSSETPLQWDESGYGFYYWDWATKTTNRTTHSNVYWGEYAMMDVTPTGDEGYGYLLSGVHDRKYARTNGAESGRFFYVDASQTPGVVANLRFSEGGLCPGSRMFVSAWVNNVGEGTKPNLNFEVVGLDANGAETAIATYTTGDLDLKENSARGKWHQVFFEVDVPQFSYADYRLRIVNNAQSASGNDFAIDEVAVYMQKPALMAYQANAACSVLEDGMVMVRLDPNGLEAIPTDNNKKTIYYQFQNDDAAHTALEFKDYQKVSGASDGDSYGCLLINTASYKGYKTYGSLQAYLDCVEDPTCTPEHAFYVREKNADGEDVTILYVYHQSNKFLAGHTYQCVIASSKDALLQDVQCGLKSNFTIQPRVRLVLNTVAMTDVTASDICAGDLNKISLEIYGTKSGLTEVVSGTCHSDWLEGQDVDYSSTGKYSGYSFQTITTALKMFRMANATTSSLDDVAVDANYTQAYKDLLNDLVSRGLLELNQVEIYRRSKKGNSCYTAFPINGTSLAADGSVLNVCQDPVSITLTSKTTDIPVISFGNSDEQGVPTEVLEQGRTMRLSAVDANALMIHVPVASLTGVDAANLTGGAAYLLPTTTDKSVSALFDNALQAHSVYTVTTTKSGSDVTLNLSNRDVDLTLKPGHRYDFMIVADMGGSSCDATGSLSLVVVPEMVKWSPKDDSHSWNVDRNWVMIDAQGNELTTGNGYVPNANSSVLIPAGATVAVLQAVTPATSTHSAVTLNDEAQSNIEWDMNYVANTCKNIHIGAHAKFVGQNYLTYEKAWVDVALRTNGWNLMALPFEGMVVGDLYVPSTGDQTPLFTEVAEPDSRRLYEFWPSFFNKTVNEVDRNNQSVQWNYSAWTTPHNALNTPLVAANGVAVKVEDHQHQSAEVVVRLPKTATQYYYYGSYGERTNFFETIDRSAADGHRLAGSDGQVNVATGDIYDHSATSQLMANPYLAELDMLSFMADATNSRYVNGCYAVIDPIDRSTRLIDLTAGISNAGRVTDEDRYVEPMTSFMVSLASASNPQLQVSPTMIKDYSATATGASSVRAKSVMEADNQVLVIKGVRNGRASSCAIVAHADGINGYDAHDGRLMMLQSDLTPSEIYTSADSMALSINSLNSIEMVPVGYAVIDSTATTSLNLTFTGVDEFDGTLTLYDSETNQSVVLTDSMTLSLPELATSGMRYYICYQQRVATAVDDVDGLGDLVLYAPATGQVDVACSSLMHSIRVYGVNGQLITERESVENSLAHFSLPTGVYIFDVVSETGVYRQKYVVR